MLPLAVGMAIVWFVIALWQWQRPRVESLWVEGARAGLAAVLAAPPLAFVLTLVLPVSAFTFAERMLVPPEFATLGTCLVLCWFLLLAWRLRGAPRPTSYE